MSQYFACYFDSNTVNLEGRKGLLLLRIRMRMTHYTLLVLRARFMIKLLFYSLLLAMPILLWVAVVLLLVLLTLVVWYVLNRRTYQLALAEQHTLFAKLALLEGKVLHTQLHSHFMFNSLNAIRNLMLKENHTSAIEHITQFAQLLRIILQHTGKEMICLSDEIKAVELYTRLEQLRLDEAINITVQVASDVDIDAYYVPPMICQSFVENAIWYGIRPKKSAGNIIISVTRVPMTQQLVISIKDDGIGRRAAKAQQTGRPIESSQTMGHSLLEERIRLLKEYNNINITVNVVDLYENTQPSGTLVELKLPLHDSGHLN